jgi:hypothetical protein
MVQFNTSGVEVRFIQNILKNTYLPLMPTVTIGDYLIKGATYVYNNSVIHCDKTGTLINNKPVIDGIQYVMRSDGVKLCASAGGYSVCGKNFICGEGPAIAEYTVLQTFSYSKPSPGITYRYSASSNYYDVHTHQQLGNYLRWYRDTKGIDLMSLYNCFTGEDTSFIHIKDRQIENGNDSDATTWIVPAKLNKKYTIYVNSPYKVSVGATFLNGFGRVKYNGVQSKKFLDELLDTEVVERLSSSYNFPITIKTYTDESELISYTNNFYLVIQTDKRHSNSIIVLESSNTISKSKIVTNREIFEEGVDYTTFSPIVNSSMTLFPASYQVPYSNRLIEFLTENAITSVEDISKNISRVRAKLDPDMEVNVANGIWTDTLRFILYNKYFKYSNRYLFKSSSMSQEDIKEQIQDLNIPDEMIVYLKNSDGKHIDIDGNVIEDDYGNIRQGKKKVIVGLRNCEFKNEYGTPYDITGYVDKDVENSLFKYRSVL